MRVLKIMTIICLVLGISGCTYNKNKEWYIVDIRTKAKNRETPFVKEFFPYGEKILFMCKFSVDKGGNPQTNCVKEYKFIEGDLNNKFLEIKKKGILVGNYIKEDKITKKDDISKMRYIKDWGGYEKTEIIQFGDKRFWDYFENNFFEGMYLMYKYKAVKSEIGEFYLKNNLVRERIPFELWDAVIWRAGDNIRYKNEKGMYVCMYVDSKGNLSKDVKGSETDVEPYYLCRNDIKKTTEYRL
ncbi:hypothetical protein Dip518_001567 [Parelusimicrobium proximum]|uniref:hypothetical protein n=1 Tax=Parelusimicrobium proximum TaxID=3228953 RepID=UPI003D18667D